jgi:uridine kinase
MKQQPQNTQDPSAVHASLGFLLAVAVDELFPDRTLFIEHSFIGGYYCHFHKRDSFSADDLQALANRIREYCHGSDPLELMDIPRRELETRFRNLNRDDKLEILQRLGQDWVPATRFRQYCDYRFESMTVHMDQLARFSLDPYREGFLLRFPNLLPPHDLSPMKDSPKLYQVIQQREEWGRALRVSNLNQLNNLLEAGGGRELTWVAEGLHEKTIASIADGLVAGHPDRRVIFISGPSSSGKTTFAKRLAVQLKVNLFNTLAISMDDYFRDRSEMPELPDGTLDFEALETLNIPRLVQDIQALLEGRSINRRCFKFKEGIGIDTEEQLHLGPDTFLILEGIHGLNPVFPAQLGADRVQRIYISAITQLNVDNEHRVSSSDNRLLRRLVRDAQFRGHDAEATLRQWPKVRLGEVQHIFAHQEEADFMFNSSLIYELAVLRKKAAAVLKSVSKKSPAHPKARRLLTFLSFIAPLDDQAVPPTSILREFLGGSAFNY